jgi:hypothetical protein
MLGAVLKLPKPWVLTVAGLAVLSSVSVEHPASGGWGIDINVDTATVGIVALVWLPALLRLLSLTGGKVKAAGVEASSGGLLGSPENLIEDLTEIRTGAEEAGRRSPEVDRAMEQMRQQIDEMASEYLGASDAVTEHSIERLAEEYEAIRATMPPGASRTTRMTRVVNEARVRAGANRDTARRLATPHLRSDREGQRLVALAMLQESPSSKAVDGILKLIAESSTAFEMFHALLALREAAPRMSAEELESAIVVLSTEKDDPRGVGVMADPNLPGLVDSVLSNLEAGVEASRHGRA